MSTATCRQFCTMECVFYGVPLSMLPGVLFFRCSFSSVMYVCGHEVMIEARGLITSLVDRWKWRIFCGVYETAGGAQRCRAEETTQLSLSSPAVLCLFVFYCFRCAPVSYCQIYYRSFIVWRSPICMPNTQTLMLLLQAETCICMYEAAISSFLNSPNSRSRPMRCTLHTCNNMRRIFLRDFIHAALLYGALGGNLKESLREVIIKAFCLTTWSKVLSMKQGSLFCYVLSRWDLPNHGTSCHALGIFRKL